MVNKEHMELLEKLGFGADVEKFEDYIAELNASFGKGEPKVDNNTWDALMELLKHVKPDSTLLKQNWEDDSTEENSVLLKNYPMGSIKTIMEYDELGDFEKACMAKGNNGVIKVNASFKLNGHGIRLHYEHGKFMYAKTRGRTGKGRDISRHVIMAGALEYVNEWKELEEVEVRCEAVIKVEDYNNYFSDRYKHPLACVTHLVADSTPDEELKYLDICCYKLIGVPGLESLTDEMRMLDNIGFPTPPYISCNIRLDNIVGNIKAIVSNFEQVEKNGGIPYDTDGVVIAIDNREDFYSCPVDGNKNTGNVAMKVGERWATNYFESTIEEVIWTPGKKYWVPKARIVPVSMPNGATVTMVPLYNVGVMEMYGFYTGATIHFRFGGESGVMACDRFGNNVSSKIV